MKLSRIDPLAGLVLVMGISAFVTLGRNSPLFRLVISYIWPVFIPLLLWGFTPRLAWGFVGEALQDFGDMLRHVGTFLSTWVCAPLELGAHELLHEMGWTRGRAGNAVKSFFNSAKEAHYKASFLRIIHVFKCLFDFIIHVTTQLRSPRVSEIITDQSLRHSIHMSPNPVRVEARSRQPKPIYRGARDFSNNATNNTLTTPGLKGILKKPKVGSQSIYAEYDGSEYMMSGALQPVTDSPDTRFETSHPESARQVRGASKPTRIPSRKLREDLSVWHPHSGTWITPDEPGFDVNRQWWCLDEYDRKIKDSRYRPYRPSLEL